LACAVAVLATAPQLPAQPLPPPLRFTEALIQPSRQQRSGDGGCLLPGHPLQISEHALTILCAELRTIVAYAYEVPYDRVTGPEWIAGPGVPRFDVQADLPDGARDYQIPEMLRALLAERLHLVAHRETHQESVDCLVVTARGLRLPPAEESGISISIGEAAAQAGGAGEAVVVNGITSWLGPHSPIGVGTLLRRGEHSVYTASLINWRAGTVTDTRDTAVGSDVGTHVRLQTPSTTTKGITDILVWAGASREIEDLTQTSGRFKFDISLRSAWAPGPSRVTLPLPGRGPSAPTAYSEARLKEFNKALAPLGLRVEPRTAPVELVIVDSADRTPANQ